MRRFPPNGALVIRLARPTAPEPGSRLPPAPPPPATFPSLYGGHCLKLIANLPISFLPESGGGAARPVGT